MEKVKKDLYIAKKHRRAVLGAVCLVCIAKLQPLLQLKTDSWSEFANWSSNWISNVTRA